MKSEKFFITTAIPYANDQPHLGHALLFSYADVLARHQRAAGVEVVFSLGTDEHGGKIVEKALEEKVSPKELVDRVSSQFQDVLKPLGISHNRFIRTTNPDHKRRVRLAWKKLAPFIYKGEHQGSYCLGCEAYKTKTFVSQTKGICPDHQRPYEIVSESNYFFKVSAQKEKIAELINSGQIEIYPNYLKKEVLASLDGLGGQDRSVSRAKANLNWGIEVPDDPDQIIYVWFDALLNYITVLGYPEKPDFINFWPADVQVIGRDILYFHAIIWPAILLSLDLPVYRKLYVHGLVTAAGQKMSKSLGNSVDPLDLIDQFGLDAFRNYFLGQIPSDQDGDYSFAKFAKNYNNQLVDTLGNLIWRLKTLIAKFELADHKEKFLLPKRPDLEKIVADHLDNFRFDKALAAIWAEIRFLNSYLEEKSPWSLSEKEASQRAEVILAVSQRLQTIGRVLEPFLPQSAQAIQAAFDPNSPELKEPPFKKYQPKQD